VSDDPRRIHALDFLRGTFILLAYIQHFMGFINHWYPPNVPPPARLAIDDTLHALMWTLTPAGDHLFLVLAAFNLANRKQDDFREAFPRKLRFFGVLFLFFAVEPFLVETTLGEALSFGPLLAWMIILATLAVLHRFLGWKGVLGAFLLHLVLLAAVDTKALGLRIEEAAQSALRLPDFRYESRLDLFFGSGATGFLAGTWYHHGPWELPRRLRVAIACAALALVPWAIGGTWWVVDRTDVWRHEYAVAETGLGIVMIWSTNVLAVSTLLLVEHTWRPVRIPLVNWCGVASLLAFALHRIVFTRVLAPLRDYAGVRLDWPVENTIGEIAVFIALTLLAVRLVQKTRLLAILDR
jgi:hypothetical protein